MIGDGDVFQLEDSDFRILRKIYYKNISVGSYVIPLESRMLILVTFMLIPKIGCHFLGHLEVIFRPLEVMTSGSNFFFFFFNTCLTSRVTHQIV